MSLCFLFLFVFSAFTANIAGAEVTAGGREEPKPVFSRFIGPDDCPGVRHNADPYVLKEGDAWYITCTYGASRAKYMFKTTDWVSKKRYSLDIDFNNGYLRRHFNNAKVTGSAIWGFVPYKHTDGSWHGYGSVVVGKFKTVICHFSPVGDGNWPVTRWKMDKVLMGGLSSQTYETKVYSDAGGLYLIYVDNLDDGNNHIMAQKLVEPDEIDTSFKARAILSPEGLNSEYRNDPNGMQICEGMNISHVTSGGVSKYVMFYAVGDFAESNYKLGVAYSDVLIPPAGKKYIKPKAADSLNIWGNLPGADEVVYPMQTQKKGWYNYYARLMNGPGLGNLVQYCGDYYIIFHARNPGRSGGSGRWVWICPAKLDFGAKNMYQWMRAGSGGQELAYIDLIGRPSNMESPSTSPQAGEQRHHLSNKDRIRPYEENPRYWQYKGKPVMLLGGSKTDHIFLLDDLKEHLDEMQAVGANYVRNTMSQREGKDLKPHKLLPDGKFDLDQWNQEYWNRFANCLKWCNERDIIIQIEVWDRFDYSRAQWKHSPWQPDNNVNYTNEQSGLADDYPHHPGSNNQPFFYTVPGTDRYEKRYDIIRHQQERFVDKMLSYSLKYGNVLYCMDNETSGSAQWGKYWSEWIKRRAAEAKVEVHTTEMWNAWDIKHDTHKRTYDHPETYSFIDISQNTHISGQVHWDNLSWVREYIAKAVRPMNNTKIYGANTGNYGKNRDAEERFWRNIIGGLASSRFHRPNSGLGLNNRAKAQIKSMRMLTAELDIFNCTPDQHGKLLADRTANEAFLTYIAGRQYAVYFPNGGSVQIDLSGVTGSFKTKWMDIAQSKWQGIKAIQGGSRVNLQSPGKGHWVVLLNCE